LAERTENLLKAEFKRRGVGRELTEMLAAMGTPETERSIANRISRGGFTDRVLGRSWGARGALRLTERSTL
jgi:hypothetical protein